MTIGWADIEQKTFNTDIYFKMSKGDAKVKFRPLGDLYIFKKYMFNHSGRWRIAVCLDEETCPVAAKHNITPAVRYAINVIDRRDNTIKILETSIKVAKELKVFFEKTGKEPGGTDGAEYNMSFEESGGKWKYSASFAGSHTLSEVDISLKKKQGLHKIKTIYKATDPSKIEEVLFGDIISQNSADKIVYKEEVKLDNMKFNI